MKVMAMSDLHGYLIPVEDLTSCELVCICGDIVPLEIQANSRKTKQWLRQQFKSWAESLPCEKVIFIAGNHDLHFNLKFMEEHFPFEAKVTYLCHEKYTHEAGGREYLIFGTPYCRQFGNWAYMEDQETLKKLYEEIPSHCDILLTHDQPYEYGDILLQKMSWYTGEHIGNPALRDAILDKQPKYLFCGHLHSTTHECVKIGQTERYNVSIKDERYDSVYEPLIIEI